MVEIPQEGENPFADTGDETPAESAAENKDEMEEKDDEQKDGNAGASGAKNEEDDKNIPFHQHPAWKRREEEWKAKFNDQETRHQNDIASIRQEFAGMRKENNESEEIPSWFGGDKDQWNEYRSWTDKQIKAAEERAISRLNENKSAEEKAVKEATEFMRSEIESIEGDQELNPDGKKIDPNKLLKVVMDNDLVDSKGRWNYRAGWRLINSQSPQTSPKKDNTERKTIAGATTAQPQRGESTTKQFKTADDFKNDRPW